MNFVLDASVALCWLLDDETNALADRAKGLIAEGAVPIVPPLWIVEVTNGLAVAVRRKRLATKEAAAGLATLLELPITIRPQTMAYQAFAQGLLGLCFTYNLTAYDASYLGLAMEHRLPLATLDHDLARAARRAGIEDIG